MPEREVSRRQAILIAGGLAAMPVINTIPGCSFDREKVQEPKKEIRDTIDSTQNFFLSWMQQEINDNRNPDTQTDKQTTVDDAENLVKVQYKDGPLLFLAKEDFYATAASGRIQIYTLRVSEHLDDGQEKEIYQSQVLRIPRFSSTLSAQTQKEAMGVFDHAEQGIVTTVGKVEDIKPPQRPATPADAKKILLWAQQAKGALTRGEPFTPPQIL